MCKSLAASALICVFLLAGLRDGNAQSQSEQTTNASPQKVKAYKTLNLGDNTETVVKKTSEIIGEENANDYAEPDIYSSETFGRALFDTDAEYESYQSEKLESLKNYHSVEK